jgi:hypothetical protein
MGARHQSRGPYALPQKETKTDRLDLNCHSKIGGSRSRHGTNCDLRHTCLITQDRPPRAAARLAPNVRLPCHYCLRVSTLPASGKQRLQRNMSNESSSCLAPGLPPARARVYACTATVSVCCCGGARRRAAARYPRSPSSVSNARPCPLVRIAFRDEHSGHLLGAVSACGVACSEDSVGKDVLGTNWVVKASSESGF